jgi:hypothetical protein
MSQMALLNPQIGTPQEEEWREMQAVLQSGILDKAPNLLDFLNYMAERHFSNATDQIKEYSIAVLALHRSEQFDPQLDTIVRVTAHTLRKKLEQYYAAEGADHPIQIRLPAGKYALQFDRKKRTIVTPDALADTNQPIEESAPDIRRTINTKWLIPLVLASFFALGVIMLGIGFSRHKQGGLAARPESSMPVTGAVAGPGTGTGSGARTAALAAPDRSIRIRFGTNALSYLDVAGQTWTADQYCQGGSSFSHPNTEIQGTDDPSLFLNGRQGRFRCKIPAPPGSYQLLLLFADTEVDKEGARAVDFSINESLTFPLDIVDEAGGDDIVLGKVYPGIHPMSDGTIHLDFTSDTSFINALELMPAESDAMQPLRMLAGPAVFRDSQGNIWRPERFFQGGRRTVHSVSLPKVADSKLFEWERYGHSHYSIPVVAGKDYRVRLYFSEGWFGSYNGGPGGVDSRVFDVYCNGTTLLKNFDILKYNKNGTAVITFDHVMPTAHGILELDFMPVENYPLINAIEVEPEV